MMKKLFLLGVCMALCLTMQAKKLGVYCFFADNGQQIYEDETVKVALAVENNAVVLALYNKTDDIVFVDKGQSFVYTNGTPTNLFGNTSVTTTESTGSGASLNLGGLAGALGIGGVAGGLLGGTTVGGGSSVGTGTTVYEKRVISVAPKSVSILYTWSNPKLLFNEQLIKVGGDIHHDRLIDPLSGEKTKIQLGMTRHYDEASTLLSLLGMVKYSLKEDFSTSKTAKVYNYISDYVVDSAKGLKKAWPLPYCQPYNGKTVLGYSSGPAMSVGAIVAITLGSSFAVGGLVTWAAITGAI